MNNSSNDVAMWLNVLNKHNKEHLSLFVHEFTQLKKLAPIEVIRTIRSKSGEAEIFFIDRLATIRLLKHLYAFHTKNEATEQLSGYLES